MTAMDQYDASVLKCLTEMRKEIGYIKRELSKINDKVDKLKEEQINFMSAFPNGIDSHKNDHKKKKWFLF